MVEALINGVTQWVDPTQLVVGDFVMNNGRWDPWCNSFPPQPFGVLMFLFVAVAFYGLYWLNKEGFIDYLLAKKEIEP